MGKVELLYIPSTGQVDDIFTNALDEKSLNKLSEGLGMLSMY